MYGGAPFGARSLSAVRNPETSASRRLLIIAAMVFSIRNTASVRCSVGVRLSEGPLWEVPLYSLPWMYAFPSCDVQSIIHVPL